MAVKNITDDDFEKAVEVGLVLVDFWAQWCGPCRLVAPVMEELSAEMPEVLFVKLNVDENKLTAGKLGITAIPALVLYRNGKFLDRVVGALPKLQLRNFVAKHM